MQGQENSPTPFGRQNKRRKVAHTLVGDPLSSDAEVAPSVFPTGVDEGNDDDPFAVHDSIESGLNTPSSLYATRHEISMPATRIERIDDRGISGRMLHLNVGSNPRTRRQHYVYPVASKSLDLYYYSGV
jgi:hypothetical protein